MSRSVVLYEFVYTAHTSTDANITTNVGEILNLTLKNLFYCLFKSIHQ